MERTASPPSDSDRGHDYYAVLDRVITAVSQDRFQLRRMVYELAQLRLRKELYQRFDEVGAAGVREHRQALEVAIKRYEADVQRDEPLSLLYRLATEHRVSQRLTATASVPDSEPPKQLISNGYDPPIAYSPVPTSPLAAQHTLSPPAIVERGEHLTVAVPTHRFRAVLFSTMQLVIAAALGAAIYTAISSRAPFRHDDARKEAVAANSVLTEPSSVLSKTNVAPLSESSFRPGVPSIPLPGAYGVYAISDGRLTDLDLLPVRVPDRRVAISTLIPTPSRVHLPVGQLQFVVFRRDLLNNVPDHVDVRVIARVERALSFDAAGKATVTSIDGPWMVRSSSYQMRVAPVADNPEMIVIRPAHAELVFPAGRYALVIKNLGYDFTLDGALTDMAHCLERTEAVSAAIYTECRAQ